MKECRFSMECEFQSRYQPASKKSEPAQIKPLSRKAQNRYYKLYSGDILDLDTKTILDRQQLRSILIA